MSKAGVARLSGITIFTRDVNKSCGFWSMALGIKVKYLSKSLAEQPFLHNQSLIIKRVDSESFCSAGYNPQQTFNVEDFDSVYAKLKEYGAIEDGQPIQDDKEKVACQRTPDNVMISIIQELSEDKILDQKEETPIDKIGIQKEKTEEDEAQDEVKELFKNIKI